MFLQNCIFTNQPTVESENMVKTISWTMENDDDKARQKIHEAYKFSFLKFMHLCISRNSLNELHKKIATAYARSPRHEAVG